MQWPQNINSCVPYVIINKQFRLYIWLEISFIVAIGKPKVRREVVIISSGRLATGVPVQSLLWNKLHFN